MARKPEQKEIEKTGHSWDGIEEYNNPLPRWWLWTFYATIVWGIIYTIAYPAWPLVNRATEGVLGWSTRAEVAKDIESFRAKNAEIDARLAAADVTAVPSDPELMSYATNAGAAVFRTACIQCHGAEGRGAKGYPNLQDDDWLWGGDLEAIAYTIRHGIRSDSDETRFSEMPKFGEFLEENEIEQVVNYVLQISGQDYDPQLAGAGETVFADNCAACHGDDGTGDRDQGAPNLTDAIWFYGGDAETITETVTNSRYGVMPAWAEEFRSGTGLTDSEINAVAVYVHSLGGGE